MPDRLALYPQEVRGAAIERAILDLEATAWDRTPGETFPSAPETHAAFFVLLEGERAVCHVGIRRARLLHRGQSYAVCGLSEVVTHPLRRRQGLATALCLRAAEWIRAQGVDLSLFTCASERAALYGRAGWEPIPGACLVGGTREAPFRSGDLGLVTLGMFLSPRAREHAADFAHADIVLELGRGQLW